MAALRGTSAPSARALEFLILTCLRSGEVLGARWSEIDMEAGVWTVPASRMKVKQRDHRVALSSAAMDVLKATPRFAGTDLIFPNPSSRKPLSGLVPLIRRMHEAEQRAGRPGWLDPGTGEMVVPHGFRSTFRVWATEQTDYPRELPEMAMAHMVGNEVERAYNRTDALEKRRAMMEDWADFVLSAVSPRLRAVG